MFHASINCLVLFMHPIPCAWALDRASAGNSIAARIAMIAMTTSNSIRVNPRCDLSVVKLPRNLPRQNTLIFQTSFAGRLFEPQRPAASKVRPVALALLGEGRSLHGQLRTVT